MRNRNKIFFVMTENEATGKCLSWLISSPTEEDTMNVFSQMKITTVRTCVLVHDVIDTEEKNAGLTYVKMLKEV